MNPQARIRPAPCARCRRLRLLLLGLAAAVLLAWAPLGAGAGSAAPAPTAAATSGAPPGPPASAAAAELIYRELVLLVVDEGRELKARRLVRPGVAPFALEFDPERLPPGLRIDAAGVLSGQPLKAGEFAFTLRLVEGQRQSEQRYLIRVRNPANAARKPPPPPTVPASSASGKPRFPLAMPRVWLLSKDDVDALLVPTEEQLRIAEEAKNAGEDLPRPTEEQLREILEPLVDQEFFTEVQLRLALQHSVCNLFRRMVVEIGREERKRLDETCPPRPLGAASSPGSNAKVIAGLRALVLLHYTLDLQAAADAYLKPVAAASAAGGVARTPRPKDLTLASFYAELMSAQQAQDIVDAAVKARPLEAAQALQLEPQAGCGCSQSSPTDDVYGLMGWWQGTAEPQRVDFSMFTRLSVLGAVLRDEGDFATAPTPGRLGFVQAARRHNVAVDLGIYRRNWVGLGSWPQQKVDDFVRRGAMEAVRMLQTPLGGAQAAGNRLLPGFMGDRPWAFSGLTVFFDDNTLSDADRQAYGRFVQDFVRNVVAQMRRTNPPAAWPVGPAASAAGQVSQAVEPRASRPYRLNIVVPDYLVQEGKVFNVDNLWRFVQLSERVLTEEELASRRKEVLNDREGRNTPPLDVEVKFLVLLSDPTTDFKKLLRERLDGSKTVTGSERVALLQSIVPVLRVARDVKAPLDSEAATQLDDDVAYMHWNFGGVGLWSLPVAQRGHGDRAMLALQKSYATPQGLGARVCSFVCPNRVWLRLTLEGLVLATVALSLLFWHSCVVRNHRRYVLPTMVILGILSCAVFLTLLSCDPLLAKLKEQNAVLAFVALVVGGLLLWWAWAPAEDST